MPSPTRRTLLISFSATLLTVGCSRRAAAPVTPARALAAPGSAGVACLQEAMYFEAGGTGAVGRQAVGNVIMNRVTDARFPSSICGVVSEGEGSGRGCQFSYRCDGRAEIIRDRGEYALAGETALLVAGGSLGDITNGALFFHAASIAPGWFATRARTGQFGGNIFYR